MDSSDSMDENAIKSSDSSDTKEISEPPLSKRKKKNSRDENKNNISSTPSKPSCSSKRSRERQAKEGTKSSSKKMKKSQVDDKGNATAVTGAEKSPWKRGLFWTPEDEVAYLKGLVAFCEKGKLRNLPKKMGHFFEVVRKNMDGQYSHDQLYSKLHWFKDKYFGARDKIKANGFVGFKNAHEEAVYMLSKQVWGKGEEEKDGSEKMGKGGSARGEEEKKLVVGDAGEEEDETEDGDEEGDDEEEKEKEEEEEEEEEEEGHDKCEQTDNVDVKKEREVSPVAGMDTEKNEENGGEETDSSKENVGEEESSEESEEENPLQHISNGRANGSVSTAVQNLRFDQFTNQLMNITMKKVLGSSNLLMRSPFERDLPALSAKEVEMFDRKWQAQHLIELELFGKRLALVQEEYQLRLAMLRRMLDKASP